MSSARRRKWRINSPFNFTPRAATIWRLEFLSPAIMEQESRSMKRRPTNFATPTDVSTTMNSGSQRIALFLLTALSALLAGCPTTNNSPAKKSAAATKQPLVLLVADDHELGKAIAREWLGRIEGELTVRDV